MKVALARQAGVPGNTHFGYAETFHIFDIDVDPPALLEIRANVPHCDDDGGDQSRLARAADLLVDCDAVLASAIGPCAREALSARDIVPIEHNGPGLDGATGVIQAIKTHLDRTRHIRRVPDRIPHDRSQHSRSGPSQIAGRRASQQEAAR